MSTTTTSLTSEEIARFADMVGKRAYFGDERKECQIEALHIRKRNDGSRYADFSFFTKNENLLKGASSNQVFTSRDKPKKNLVDIADLPPWHTMTNRGRFLRQLDGRVSTMTPDSVLVFDRDIKDIQIAESTDWRAWNGGECPLPEGVAIESLHRSGHKQHSKPSELCWYHDCDSCSKDVEVIAYRILGLAEGYTLNPDEAEPCQPT